jgi:hypothetical protein
MGSGFWEAPFNGFTMDRRGRAMCQDKCRAWSWDGGDDEVIMIYFTPWEIWMLRQHARCQEEPDKKVFEVSRGSFLGVI